MLACAAMLLTLVNQVHAQGESTRSEFFRQKMSESTLVVGYRFSNPRTHPFCTVNVGWRDGSYLLMSVDLLDGEFWIRIVNNAWSNPNPDYLDTMKVRINFLLMANLLMATSSTSDSLPKMSFTFRTLSGRRFWMPYHVPMSSLL
jgi:hypothetical protein